MGIRSDRVRATDRVHHLVSSPEAALERRHDFHPAHSSSKEDSLSVAACACAPSPLSSINRVLAESTGKQKPFPLTPPQRIFRSPSPRRQIHQEPKGKPPGTIDPPSSRRSVYSSVVFVPRSPPVATVLVVLDLQFSSLS
nr:unnamed protein product [Digitaria exilis]